MKIELHRSFEKLLNMSTYSYPENICLHVLTTVFMLARVMYSTTVLKDASFTASVVDNVNMHL